MKTKHTIGITFVVVALLLSACGGGGGGSDKSTTTVGVAGGTVVGSNSLRVEIPAGALDSDVEIGVKVSSTGAPALPEGADPATTVYEFTPHGIAFNKPVTISLPSTNDPTVKPVMMAEQGDAGWTTVNATQSGDRVTWQVMGFSWGIGPVDCLIPNNDPDPDPHPCVVPRSLAVLAAQPAPALTQTGYGSIDRYQLSEEGTVSLTFRYTVAADCWNPTVKIVRYRPDVKDANGLPTERVLMDGSAPLTTLSPAGHSITGEVKLLNLNFTYAERAQHFFRMHMQCNRTHDNRLQATGGQVLIDTSAMAASALPSITQQPTDQTVTASATATFTVSVTGTPAPSLQWQISTDGGVTWTDIPGATGASYTTPATANGDNGNRYRAVATNSASPGGVPSNGATLTVSGAALVTSPYGKISALYGHVCAVTATGQLRCWGEGFSGQLGNGGSTSSATPVLVSNLTNVEFVSAGSSDTCAIHGGGQLSCWGFWSDSLTPRPMGVSNAAWVSVGANHVCHVNTGGEIWCWGQNSGGQLGDGTQTDRLRTNPVQVRWSNGTVVTGAVSVAAGDTYTCAKTSGGEVYCWGTMSASMRTAPERQVMLLPNGTTTDFTITGHIAGGLDHACAIESSGGQTVCWGYNTYGYLGDNDVTGRDTAVAVGAFGIGNVAVGQYHSCSLDSATGASLTCWGRTYFGNGGSVVTLLYPQTAGRVSSYYNNSTPIAAVAAGSDFTCALLKTSGDVQCWGSGGAGQIGNGGTSNALTPTSTSAGAIFWKP